MTRVPESSSIFFFWQSQEKSDWNATYYALADVKFVAILCH